MPILLLTADAVNRAPQLDLKGPACLLSAPDSVLPLICPFASCHTQSDAALLSSLRQCSVAHKPMTFQICRVQKGGDAAEASYERGGWRP